jgi:aerobic carbon-monoxide dehydrogenase medium subunit
LLKPEHQATGAGEAGLKAPRFRYLKPHSLAEALDMLGGNASGTRLLAGGQSLVPALNMRLLEPEALIDINGLGELTGITERGGALILGALTRHAELISSPLVAKFAPLLAKAAPFIAHAAIRNRGTLGGSLAHADPAAELPACAVALDAEIHLASRTGRRRVKARDFFIGIYQTVLAPGEILVAVEIPASRPGQKNVFLELARRQGDYALCGLAFTAEIKAETIADSRAVYFGIGAKPVEAQKAEAALKGKTPLDAPDAACAALAAELAPLGDFNAGADMKRHLAQVLLRRALGQLAVS